MSVLNEVLLTETSHIQKYEENQERQSKIEDETKDHFTIENVEGIFIIRLEAGFDSKDMDNLNTAMQGIMFVRPLKIKFDFGGLNEFDDGYLNRIMVYAKKAMDSGGNYESLVQGESLKAIVEHKEETYLQ